MDSYKKHITTILQILTELNIKAEKDDADILEQYNKVIQQHGNKKIQEMYQMYWS